MHTDKYSKLMLTIIAAILGWMAYTDYYSHDVPQEVVIVGVSIPQNPYAPPNYGAYAPKKVLPVDVVE